jgi:hypothetical protein
MHDKFTSSDPQPDPSTPSWVPFLVYISYIYIYIGRDIWGPTTAKAETRQKGKPTNPTSNLWISFSLVCSSPNPFESLKTTIVLILSWPKLSLGLEICPLILVPPCKLIHLQKKHIPSLFVLWYRISKSTLVPSFVSVHSLKTMGYEGIKHPNL